MSQRDAISVECNQYTDTYIVRVYNLALETVGASKWRLIVSEFTDIQIIERCTSAGGVGTEVPAMIAVNAARFTCSDAREGEKLLKQMWQVGIFTWENYDDLLIEWIRVCDKDKKQDE
ncbi:MAG: hypothetical protein GWN00_01020 [Aliifodinibius sp.]|nr:hypothetical protein [Fodinibius sp.]NIV09912.1 hypothetical protein [Fodinibius sp.]NIY23442.1 hypothetical protein [Fodinibius sp.]